MSNSTERNGSKHHVTEHHRFFIEEAAEGLGSEFKSLLSNKYVYWGGMQKCERANVLFKVSSVSQTTNHLHSLGQLSDRVAARGTENPYRIS